MKYPLISPTLSSRSVVACDDTLAAGPNSKSAVKDRAFLAFRSTTVREVSRSLDLLSSEDFEVAS